jgi:DNA repair protein RecO (recombination protein O)
MLQTTNGIVLNSVRYSDQAVICRIFTQVQTLQNLRIEKPLQQIYMDPTKSATVMFLDEILYRSIQDDYSNAELFSFLYDAIVLLDEEVETKNFHLWFILELSRYYGFYPQNFSDVKHKHFDLAEGVFVAAPPAHPHFTDSRLTSILDLFVDKVYTEVRAVDMTKADRASLLEALLKYLKLHLENFREIKSLEVFKQVFQ